MFCPGCGLEEVHANQFCRACGTDLRPARKTLEMPDSITASADSAREESGRAFAGKIREVAPMADPATRTFTARVSLVEASADIKLGMTAYVSIDTGRTRTLASIFGNGAAIAARPQAQDMTKAD